MSLKNTAGKWLVFAFGAPAHATLAGLPITGDALNITANLRIDGGAANAVDDINPTELEDGYYIFDITAAEFNGDLISMHPASSTANVQVIGCPAAVWTTTAPLTATTVRSAVGLASADLDSQLAAIPTTAALTASGVRTAVGLATANLDTQLTGLTTSVNNVRQATVRKNQTYSDFVFPMKLSSDHFSAATGRTVTATRSLDGGAFTAASGSVTEISAGMYQFDALAADTNGDTVTWKFSAAASDDTVVTIKTSV